MTYLVMFDLNPHLVMEIAGHESLKTKERYVHAEAPQLLSGGAG